MLESGPEGGVNEGVKTRILAVVTVRLKEDMHAMQLKGVPPDRGSSMSGDAGSGLISEWR